MVNQLREKTKATSSQQVAATSLSNNQKKKNHRACLDPVDNRIGTIDKEISAYSLFNCQ